MSELPKIPDMTLHDYIFIMAMPVVAQHMKDEISNMQSSIAQFKENLTAEEEIAFDAECRMQAIALIAHDMATHMMAVREMRNERNNT